LNRADVRDLDRLPGVGPVLAERIVEHRKRHGPYRRLEDLRAVRGIGVKLLERIRPHVRVQ
jgi:competence protein ComEA